MKYYLNFALFLLFAVATPLVSFADDDDIETRGQISLLTSTEIVVSGVSYEINSDTEFKDENDNPLTADDFNLGDFVKVKGPREGDSLIAEEVERKNDEDDDDHGGNSDSRITFRGIVTEYTENSSISLGDENILIIPSTTYEGLDGQPISSSEIAVGKIVKVKAFYNQSNILTAKEIELEDSINSGGDDNESGNSSKSGEIKLTCQVPNLKALEDGLEKSIEQALKDAGATKVNASVSGKIIKSQTSAPQSIAPISAIPGLVIQVDLTNTGDLLAISGEVTPDTCSAVVQVKIQIEGVNPLSGKFNQRLQFDINAQGLYIKNSRGRS